MSNDVPTTHSHQPSRDDRGPMVLTVTWLLFSFSAAVVIARALTRYRTTRVIKSTGIMLATDVLLYSSLALTLIQSVCVSLQVSSGLGRHWLTLTKIDLDRYAKFQYVELMLYMLVLCLTKITITLLIKNVEPQRPVLIGCNILLVFIMTYTIITVGIMALECGLPNPWLVTPGRCVNLESFYTAMIVINILIDFAVVALPVAMMCMLRTSREKRIFVCSLFGTRMVVPLLTIPQAYLLASVLGSSDVSYAWANLQIWVQVPLSASIVTACLPSLGHAMWAFAVNLAVTTNRRSSSQSDLESAHRQSGTTTTYPIKSDQEKSSLQDEKQKDITVEVRDLGLRGRGSDAFSDDSSNNAHDADAIHPLPSSTQQTSHHKHVPLLLTKPRRTYFNSTRHARQRTLPGKVWYLPALQSSSNVNSHVHLPSDASDTTLILKATVTTDNATTEKKSNSSTSSSNDTAIPTSRQTTNKKSSLSRLSRQSLLLDQMVEDLQAEADADAARLALPKPQFQSYYPEQLKLKPKLTHSRELRSSSSSDSDKTSTSLSDESSSLHDSIFSGTTWRNDSIFEIGKDKGSWL